MRIGEVAEKTGVNIQTLRYYERRGLLMDPRGTTSGFRQYDASVLQKVRFIRRAQTLGFTLDEIQDLLGFWPDSVEACGVVAQRATATLERIEAKINDLERMKAGLSKYVSACRDRSTLEACPLLVDLGSDETNTLTPLFTIELIYDNDCPNVDRAREMIRSALRQFGTAEDWMEWDREAEATPANRRCYGSPTVLLNGRDVGCDETGDTKSDANSCRVYLDESGKCLCGAPSANLILDALRAEVGR